MLLCFRALSAVIRFPAAIYNAITLPIADGILYPIRILRNPAIGALAMQASSITVATNAVLL
jgi:Cu2+-exporting ATPase